MPESVLALIILGGIIIVFATRIIPLGLAAVLGAVAMAVAGIITFEQAFAPFGSDIAMLLVGMLTVGNALTETGGTKILGDAVMRIPGIGKDERSSLVVIVAMASFTSMILFNTVTVALFLPILAGAAKASGGIITKKNTYMAIGFAAVIGGNLTLVASTPQIVAQGILLQTEGVQPLTFFDLTRIAVPLVITVVVYFATIGYKLQKKTFDFPEIKDSANDSAPVEINKKKAAIAGLVFLGCFAAFILEIATLGTVAIIAASICIITRCITLQRAADKMDWTAVLVLGGSLGFSRGLDQSGALQMIAQGAMDLLGYSLTPFIALGLFLILPMVLGNFFASTAATAVMVPIAIAVAFELGANPTTFAIAVVIGCSLSIATPVATPPITMTLSGGYRFGDYTVIGGVLSIICAVVALILLPIIYGL